MLAQRWPERALEPIDCFIRRDVCTIENVVKTPVHTLPSQVQMPAGVVAIPAVQNHPAATVGFHVYLVRMLLKQLPQLDQEFLVLVRQFHVFSPGSGPPPAINGGGQYVTGISSL